MGTTPTGVLDLADNDLIDFNIGGDTPRSYIHDLLTSGFNAHDWNGNGINSSVASGITSGHRTSLGYATAAELNTAVFAGVPVDPVENAPSHYATVIVKYTYDGDSNLDGKVDVLDLGRLASNWQQQSRDWFQGNFNYSVSDNDLVDVLDLGELSSNWQSGVGGTNADAPRLDLPISPARQILLIQTPQELQVAAQTHASVDTARRLTRVSPSNKAHIA